jgi:glycerol transport system ATP-binding protein
VLTHGVHRVDIGDQIPIYIDPAKFFIFNGQDVLVSAPKVGAA